MQSKPFLNEDFLLTNKFSKTLYHDYAKSLPIIDYHNHLNPADIANNTNFNSITSVWLNGDHYKWRAMRTMGVNEKFITGNASDKEKFHKWAEVLPYAVRNPLFHWSNLELKRYFDIDELLTPKTADAIFNNTSEQLKQSSHTASGLLEMQNVEVVCTTDDPVDDLCDHINFAKQNKSLKLLPTFRPDKFYAIDNVKSYKQYLNKVSEVTGISVISYTSLLEALESRITYFHEQGCRLSDHGLEEIYFSKERHFNLETIFANIISGTTISKSESEFFKFSVLLFLSKSYHKKGWTQQFHLGAIRNNNHRLLTSLGPDTGFDSIGDYSQATKLSGYLNALDVSDELTKTIVYNLNPSFNEVFATMVGNFNDGSIKGKVQYGAAWWFMDQKDGIINHLNTLSSMGMLSSFVGMLTDSRSFLSFPRHEYFRRIVCELIGKDVDNGELPNDMAWLGKIVSDICYSNAKSYFDF